MKLCAGKTKSMIVSMSRAVHPQSPPLTIDRTMLKKSYDLDILGVSSDFKMSFEKHHRSLSFQSNFSKTWYLEEVSVSIPR